MPKTNIKKRGFAWNFIEIPFVFYRNDQENLRSLQSALARESPDPLCTAVNLHSQTRTSNQVWCCNFCMTHRVPRDVRSTSDVLASHCTSGLPLKSKCMHLYAGDVWKRLVPRPYTARVLWLESRPVPGHCQLIDSSYIFSFNRVDLYMRRQSWQSSLWSNEETNIFWNI